MYFSYLKTLKSNNSLRIKLRNCEVIKVRGKLKLMFFHLFLINAINYCNGEYVRTCKHGIDPGIVFFIPQKAACNSYILPLHLTNTNTADDLVPAKSQKLDSLADSMRKRFAQGSAFDGLVLHVFQER